MSEFAWKDCPDCGNRIHINTKCECGGDPWDISNKIKNNKEKLKQYLKDAINMFIFKYPYDNYDLGSDLISTLCGCIPDNNDIIRGIKENFKLKE